MTEEQNHALNRFFALLAERNAEAAEALSDGRRMRSERGRAAVVESLMELMNEGNHPTIAQIAERSGVSERTVFRYFPDREAIYTAIAIEILPKVMPCFSMIRSDDTFDVRLRTFLEMRVELIRIGGKFAQWVEGDDKPSGLQATVLALRGEQLREQLLIWLSPEIEGANDPLVPVLNAMLNHWPVGMLLKELSLSECVDVLHLAISRMLGA